MSSPHIAIRDCFIKQRKGDTCFGLGEWRRYRRGAWEAVSDLLIKKEIQEIGVKKGAGTTNGLVTSVFELLKAFLHVSDLLFDSNPHILVFDDCVLDFQTNTRIPHSPTHYATNRLPFKYNPQATCPEWDRFLHHLPHAEFLQEWAGYCLTPETRHEIALWLWGPPGGGKSTYVEALCAMLGAKSCILGLSEIERSQFALSQIPGRTLAVSTEQPGRIVKCPHIINALISGELITYERKFVNPVTIRSHVKLLWAMNMLPTIGMDGVGMFRRVIPLHIPAVAESERDPALKAAIINNPMAVTNWALEGERRLRERGRFTIPPELLAARDEYREKNDLTLNFIDEKCEKGPENRVRTTVLFTKYKDWCVENGYRNVAIRHFVSDLDRLGFIKIKPHNVSYYSGLALIDDSVLDSVEVDDGL